MIEDILVEIKKMTQTEFEKFLDYDGYARSLSKASGKPLEEMKRQSCIEMEKLLAQGLLTPENYLYSIFESKKDKNIGFFWLAIRLKNDEKTPYAYDIYIEKEYRQKGYASQVMIMIEEKIISLGYKEIELYIFHHNKESRALCDKLGFESNGGVLENIIDISENEKRKMRYWINL